MPGLVMNEEIGGYTRLAICLWIWPGMPIRGSWTSLDRGCCSTLLTKPGGRLGRRGKAEVKPPMASVP